MRLTTRLLILWLLAEGRQHGYQIKKSLSGPALGFWFPLEDASIYSMLRGLQGQGFIRVTGDEREGKRPQRRVYAITPAGRGELARCLEAAWLDVEPTRQPICGALAAADEWEADEQRDLLRRRQAALRERQTQFEGVARGAPSGLLARREATLLAAEIDWIGRELDHQS